jgi:hypothetical protein
MRTAAILLLTFVVSLPAAAKRPKPASSAIQVVGSLKFDHTPVDMLLRQNNGKSYLYVQLANSDGFLVVDITRPEKLKVVSSMTAGEASRLKINGNMAFATATETGANSYADVKGELVLWDISDPASPRIVQQFTGVKRVLKDDREFTYILDQGGLWVIWDKSISDDSSNATLYGG